MYTKYNILNYYKFTDKNKTICKILKDFRKNYNRYKYKASKKPYSNFNA